MTTRRISWTDLEQLFGHTELDLDEQFSINGEAFRVCGVDARGFQFAPVADDVPGAPDRESEVDG